jgi:lysophospholipase L1-like esterase
MAVNAQLLLAPDRKLLFVGDSITDSGRRETHIPYGNGFVSAARHLLLARYPALRLFIVNKGVNGDTITRIAARWERDVVAERPEYLVVCAGINDVFNQFTPSRADAVYPETFQNTYRALLRRAKEAGNPVLILMTPYLIEPNRNHPVRAQMNAYGLIVKDLAAQFGAIFIDLQAVWNAALRYTTPAFWSGDQLHPNSVGSALLAQTFLRAIQFSVR